MRRHVKIGGKVIDWRDASSFDVIVTSGQAVTLYARPETLPTTIDVDWGDGWYNSYLFTAFPTYPSFGYSYTHTYTNAGTYKIKVKTSANLAGLGCTFCSRYNSGYTKQFNKLSHVWINGGTSTQDYTGYIGVVKYLTILTSPIKLDLGKLNFSPDIQTINIAGSNPNLTGVIRCPELLPNVLYVALYGSGSINQGCYSINEIIGNTPNATYYNFQGYLSLSPVLINSDLGDMASLVATHPIISDFILLNINKGITGNGTNLFKVLYERSNIASIYLYGASTYTTELGRQSQDFYAHTPKILYLAHIVGDVSQFNFKYTAVTYLALFMDSGAYGDLNSISNVRQSATLRIILSIPNTVSLDVSSIKHLNPTGATIAAGNSLSGDISQLGSWVKCETWSLSSLSSNTITGWSNLVNNLYNNRSLFSSGPKSFNCPNVMKAALTGTYQAPAGFIKGSADGTPTTSREKIYVLVNNYKWTFTNI